MSPLRTNKAVDKKGLYSPSQLLPTKLRVEQVTNAENVQVFQQAHMPLSPQESEGHQYREHRDMMAQLDAFQALK